MIGIIEMLPGITCHYIEITFDGFYVFCIVHVEVQQVVTTQIVPSIALS